MEYTYDLTGIENFEEVCWETTDVEPEDKEEWDCESGVFFRLSPFTAALIRAASAIKLSHLGILNIVEWKYRLDQLFDAGRAFLFAATIEGEVPIRITIGDLKDHIGMKINTKTFTKEKFDRLVREIRIKRILSTNSLN